MKRWWLSIVIVAVVLLSVAIYHMATTMIDVSAPALNAGDGK